MCGHHVVGAACLAALCVLGGVGQASAAEDAPELIIGLPANGLEVAGIPEGQLVFSREREWLEFWRAHSTAPAPLVDFQQWQLAAIFLGQRPHSGYGVHIVRAVRHGDEIIVSYAESLPAPGMVYAQMIVYPCDLVAVPAGAPITFSRARTGPAEKSRAQEAHARALDTTGFSPPTQARYVAFTDETRWNAFWRSHEQCPAPEVAFEKEMVVGLLQLGNGPGVRLAGAERTDGEVLVKLASGSVTAGGSSSLLAVVPRANRVNLAWSKEAPP